MSHPPLASGSDSEVPTLPDHTALWKTSLNWQPSPEQLQQLQALYREIWQGNHTLNLTRILEPQDFWEKHLWDSLVGITPFLSVSSVSVAPTPLLDATEANPVASPPALESDPERSTPNLPKRKPAPLKLIDVGTGGGFPGLPIAIAKPEWSITLLDATQKKVNFLQQVQTHLHLTQVSTLAGRAEAIGQQPQHRSAYDFACIRAVGTASVCAEYTLPLLKMGGLAILYRGQWTAAEAEALAQAAAQLGGTVETVEQVQTPLTESIRHLIYLRKCQPTPQIYPRAIGIPSQAPL